MTLCTMIFRLPLTKADIVNGQQQTKKLLLIKSQQNQRRTENTDELHTNRGLPSTIHKGCLQLNSMDLADILPEQTLTAQLEGRMLFTNSQEMQTQTTKRCALATLWMTTKATQEDTKQSEPAHSTWCTLFGEQQTFHTKWYTMLGVQPCHTVHKPRKSVRTPQKSKNPNIKRGVGVRVGMGTATQ